MTDKKAFWHYYNTNFETDEKLQLSEMQAIHQERQIFKFFSMNPEGKYRRVDIERVFWPERNWPSSSIGRALRNLTRQGFLMKLGKEDMVMGDYNHMVHRWQFQSEMPEPEDDDDDAEDDEDWDKED